MNNDFSKPQRQSPAGIIIMALYTLQEFARALFIPLIIAIVKLNKTSLLIIGLTTLGLLVFIVIAAFLQYKYFTFYLDEEKKVFVINKGVFNKTLLTIQLEKIQQVNINQTLLQKLIGIYSLTIDTAGENNKEVSIKAIDEAAAKNLRARLLNKQDLNSLVESIAAGGNPVSYLKISWPTLFKVGLTTHYGSSLAVLISLSYAVFHNVKEFLKAFNKNEPQIDQILTNGFTLVSFCLITAALLLFLLLINLLRTFIKYYDLEISKHKDALLISVGFLAKKNTIFSLRKVQITTYSQNYFQKKLGLFNLNLKQAHDGKSKNEHDFDKANLEIPGCSAKERNKLLQLILRELPHRTQTFKPNFRFLNLPIFFKVVLPIGIYIWCWFTFNELKPFYPIAILYAVLAVLMIYFSYRRHRLSVNQNFIIKKSGIWDVSHEIIFPHKIQAITTFQYPWHKSVDVGHVNLHTAAGVIHFKYGNYTEIKKLVNYWLYQVESGSKEWM